MKNKCNLASRISAVLVAVMLLVCLLFSAQPSVADEVVILPPLSVVPDTTQPGTHACAPDTGLPVIEIVLVTMSVL